MEPLILLLSAGGGIIYPLFVVRECVRYDIYEKRILQILDNRGPKDFARLLRIFRRGLTTSPCFVVYGTLARLENKGQIFLTSDGCWMAHPRPK